MNNDGRNARGIRGRMPFAGLTVAGVNSVKAGAGGHDDRGCLQIVELTLLVALMTADVG